MFTGLIQSLGEIKNFQIDGGQARAEVVIASIDPSLKISIGDSVAVNGVCLTITKLEDAVFSAEISPETLKRTNLAKLAPRTKVNLEFPLRPNSFLGGHIVQGHVDATGKISAIQKFGDYYKFRVQYPHHLAAYFIEKGSVTIDGVSLTVNQLIDQTHEIELMIIPHTFNATIFSTYSIGQSVNIEVDVLAKYILRAAQLNETTDERKIL